MVVQVIEIGIRLAMALVVVSLLIRIGVRLARRFRPGLDPKATEAIVLRFLGNTAGYACLLLVLARAIILGERPSEGMIGVMTVIGIVGLSVVVGWFIDLARDRHKD